MKIVDIDAEDELFFEQNLFVRSNHCCSGTIA
jgi:hypothetical protein